MTPSPDAGAGLALDEVVGAGVCCRVDRISVYARLVVAVRVRRLAVRAVAVAPDLRVGPRVRRVGVVAVLACAGRPLGSFDASASKNASQPKRVRPGLDARRGFSKLALTRVEAGPRGSPAMVEEDLREERRARVAHLCGARGFSALALKRFMINSSTLVEGRSPGRRRPRPPRSWTGR